MGRPSQLQFGLVLGSPGEGLETYLLRGGQRGREREREREKGKKRVGGREREGGRRRERETHTNTETDTERESATFYFGNAHIYTIGKILQ